MGDSEIRELVDQLKEHRGPPEDWVAVAAVGEIGSPAVPYLLDALDYDHVPGTTSEDLNIIRALGHIGDDRALPALRRLLDGIGPENDIFRYRIVTAAIGQCGDKSVFPALLSGFCIPSHDGVEGAYRAFLVLGQEIVPELLGVLDDPAYWFRQSFQTLGIHSIDDEQIEKYAEGHSALLHRLIFQTLGMIGDHHAVPRLLQFMHEPQKGELHPMIRYARCSAIEALGEIGDEAAIPILREELASEHTVLRLEAAIALGRFLPEHSNSEIVSEVVKTLIDCTAAHRTEDRAKAIETLQELNHPDIVPALIRKLTDDETYWSFEASAHVPIAQYAAESLERIGTPEALAAVEAWRSGG